MHLRPQILQCIRSRHQVLEFDAGLLCQQFCQNSTPNEKILWPFNLSTTTTTATHNRCKGMAEIDAGLLCRFNSFPKI